MIVAGGVYYERCLTPPAVNLLGSGGRAAATLASFGKVQLHTFCPTDAEDDVRVNMATYGVGVEFYHSQAVVQFFYNFPLSLPRIAPVPIPRAQAAQVFGKNVIRFGAIEGDFVVNAERAVYDPQSGNTPEAFGDNKSHSESLALVLNAGELDRLTQAGRNATLQEKIAGLRDRADVVVIKEGPAGASVFDRGELIKTVPAYKSNFVYKVGSGDVFTAMFAHGWMERGLDPAAAADEASRYVAEYVETQNLRMPLKAPEREPVRLAFRPAKKRVYLAGSFFSTEHIWIIDEAFAALQSLGLDCFSPWHHVGVGTGQEIAEADLAAMDECQIVLALIADLDPGTLIELGYAISEEKQIFVVAQNNRPQDLTMLQLDGVEIIEDLATAMYKVAWAAIE